MDGFGRRLATAMMWSARDARPTILARDIGISRATAAKLLTDKCVDSYATLERIGERYNVSKRWLSTGEGSPVRRNILTPDEKRLIDLYRALPRLQQQAVLQTLVGSGLD